jgi:hypothetical protein
MFNLSETDLKKKFLGCGDGPASFNAEMTELGYLVISTDPIYELSEDKIGQRVQERYQPIISQVRQNADRYISNNFHDAKQLGDARLAAMGKFLFDYVIGRTTGRYLSRSLPELEFGDNQFELCVCCHLLFLHSE